MTRMPVPANHADHDLLLVAEYASGDASGAALARAAALVSNCAECAALHRDLRSLSSALASTPAPTRPRDFRLTAEQAATLTQPKGWRRILAPFAGARSAAGPLAASLTALGVAGLLLGGGVNVGLSGSASSAVVPQAASSGDTALSGGQGNYSAPGSARTSNTSTGAEASAAASGEAAIAPSASFGPADVPSSAPSAAASMAASQAPSAAASAAPSQLAVVSTDQPVPSTAPGVPTNVDKNTGGTAADASASTGTSGANLAPARPSPTPADHAASAASAAGPSPLVLLSLVLIVGGVALGMLRLAARRLA